MTERPWSLKVTAAAFIAMVVCGLAFAGSARFGNAQSPTPVTGIINSDTTWTKANSPYTLTGPVSVNQEVTLTVEPGVTVDLGSFHIQVNGTLRAQGSSTDQIYITGTTFNAHVSFTTFSTDWNEQTGSGCIIENAVLDGVSFLIADGSPKIDSSAFYGVDIAQGAPVISNNVISGGVNIAGGSPTFLNNSFTSAGSGSMVINGGSPQLSHNSIASRIFVNGGVSTISDNTIADGVHIDSRGGSIALTNNVITGRGTYNVIHVQGALTAISHNTLIGNGFGGIYVAGDFGASISGNIILGCSVGIGGSLLSSGKRTTIEGNAIFNNQIGIMAWPDITIRDNTIANNSVGIQDILPSTTLVNNNIQYNNQYNVFSSSGVGIDAANNWWGTTEVAAINQTIWDKKNDFNVGTVNFIPFLTAPNPAAPPIPDPIPTPVPPTTPSTSPTASSTPTSTSTPNSSPSPTQNPTSSPATLQASPNAIEIAILVVLIVIAVLLGILIAVLIKKIYKTPCNQQKCPQSRESHANI